MKMTRSYYDPGEARAAKVEDLFGDIAPRYDLINDLQSFGLHRWWKRRLVQLAVVHAGNAALDLCCGTGDVALALARLGAKTTGLDFSQPMLNVARQRLERENRAGIPLSLEWIQGDALNLPFTDQQFDAVTISYGLRNLADFHRGLAEMHRVAKPGGRLLVLDFGKPENAIWRRLYFGYLRWCVPVFGRLFCRNAPAYAYILQSLLPYPAQTGVAAAMRELGCRNVVIHNLLGGVMSINVGVKS